jgi:ribosomal protein L7/L12
MDWVPAALVFVGAIVAAITISRMESKLERAERKLNAVLRHFGIDPAQSLPLSDRVKELARDPARKIEAIKLYREETGAGLAEAKKAVETFINSK